MNFLEVIINLEISFFCEKDLKNTGQEKVWGRRNEIQLLITSLSTLKQKYCHLETEKTSRVVPKLYKQTWTHLPKIKVNKMTSFMRNVRAKVSAYNAMPRGIVFLVEFLLNICGNILQQKSISLVQLLTSLNRVNIRSHKTLSFSRKYFGDKGKSQTNLINQFLSTKFAV